MGRVSATSDQQLTSSRSRLGSTGADLGNPVGQLKMHYFPWARMPAAKASAAATRRNEGNIDITGYPKEGRNEGAPTRRRLRQRISRRHRRLDDAIRRLHASP